MAINHQVVAVGSSQTLISIPQANQIPYESKVSYSFQNLDATNPVFIGASGVTASVYGYALFAGQVFSADLLPGDSVYAIASAGTPNIAIFAAEV
jgi:hypothetical protein